jgi:transcriptional regulator with XRE-family HTH domain
MPEKKTPKKIVNRVLKLRKEGLTYAKISEELGIPVPMIRKIVKESTTPTEKPEEPGKAAAEKIEIRLPEPEIEIPEPEPEIEIPEPESPVKSPEPEDLVLTPPAISPKRPGRGRPTLAENGEAKRITTVAILPSIYDATRKICYVQRRSISDVINRFLEEFVAQNQNDLKKY